MLTFPAVLTHEQANACVAGWLSQLPEGDGPVQLHGQSLVQFDSTALAAVLELRRHLASSGRSLVLQALPERLRELAALYGVDELLAI